MKFWAVSFQGDQQFWVRLTGVDGDHPDGTGWEPSSVFDRFCLLDYDQASAFVNDQKTDSRYTLVELTLKVEIPRLEIPSLKPRVFLQVYSFLMIVYRYTSAISG